MWGPGGLFVFGRKTAGQHFLEVLIRGVSGTSGAYHKLTAEPVPICESNSSRVACVSCYQVLLLPQEGEATGCLHWFWLFMD